MAYFPNSTEGEEYYFRYCAQCVHDDPENEKSCPIWNLHLIHGYSPSPDQEEILNTLIPMSADGLKAEECRMLTLPIDGRCPETKDMFDDAD